MKKIITHILCMVLAATTLYSCKKTQQPLVVSSTLTIINAINGAGILVTNFDYNKTLFYYKTATTIDSNSYYQFNGYFGNIPLLLVQYGDTTHQVIKTNLNINHGDIQTLFLTGTIDNPEFFVTKDVVPVYKVADSLAGIRFVNLLTGNKAVNIKLLADTDKTIESNLAYKTVTGFMPFLVKANISGYTFEFSDAATGNVLTTYTLSSLSSLLLKNVTIALVGLESQNNASVILVNNYTLNL